MTNSEQVLRDFAEKQFPLSKELKKEVLYNQVQQAKQNECLSDLTALISEHYYPKEFTVWLGFMSSSINYREIDDKWLWISVDAHTMNDVWTEYTLDELFNYWEENER